MSDLKAATKIPADLANYLDALLIIESVEDAKELIANPDVIEDLEFHEADDAMDADDDKNLESK